MEDPSLWASSTSKLNVINGPYTSDGFHPKHQGFYVIDQTDTAASSVIQLTIPILSNTNKKGLAGGRAYTIRIEVYTNTGVISTISTPQIDTPGWGFSSASIMTGNIDSKANQKFTEISLDAGQVDGVIQFGITHDSSSTQKYQIYVYGIQGELTSKSNGFPWRF